MSLTLQEQIAADTLGVFLNTDTSSVGGQQSFAQQVWHWPGGDESKSVKVPAVVIEDELEGTNQVEGDGREFHTEQGVRNRKTITLHLDRSVPVAETDGKGSHSAFVVQYADGEEALYHAKRIIGRDAAMQRVSCVKVEKHLTRKQRMRG